MWRLYQVWPDDPTIAAHYVLLVWSGTDGASDKNGFGGQPAVRIESGTVTIATRGSWTGQEGQRIAGIAFIAPKSGRYHLTARASSHQWEGATRYKLGLSKKDTQRATPETLWELPRSGDPVPLDATLDLAAGQELILVGLMPDWHHATQTRIEDLTVFLVR